METIEDNRKRVLKERKPREIDYKFEPVMESEVLLATTIMIDLNNVYTSRYFITQNSGRIIIPKDRLKAFALELLDIAEVYSGTWNAQMFRK